MSHQEIISYQGVAIETQAKCDVAVASLCKIDKTLNRIHKQAHTLESKEVKEFESYLLESKEKIKTKIEEFKLSLEQYKSKKGDYDEYLNFKNQLSNKANELLSLANELTGSKLAIIDEMIDEGLLNAGQNVFESLEKKAMGTLDLDEDLMKKINAIDDISLRSLAHRELTKSNGKKISFDAIMAKAQNEYDLLLGKKTASIVSEAKEELRKHGIDAKILSNATTIDEANKISNDAIAAEKIRKETLLAIIKAIKSRGFIIDTKKNLKVDKGSNVVRFVAMKASGQKAEFEIQLNGKFMYHFDKYEGQACKKDIKPFLEDLKNIYDIDIKSEETIWSNPDKTQTQKYQYVNQNKARN